MIHKALRVVLLLLLFVFPAYASDSHVITNGSCQTINEHGVCRGITNNSGFSIMVPTKSPQEWHTGGNSFLENLPAGLVASNCSGGERFTASGFISGRSCSGSLVFIGNTGAAAGSASDFAGCASLCENTAWAQCCWKYSFFESCWATTVAGSSSSHSTHYAQIAGSSELSGCP